MALLKKHKQSGAALLISLIMLLLLTILGVATLRTTTIEEKMAGNLRDKDLAFQAAESAIREAETVLKGMINASKFYGGSGGTGVVNGYYSAYDSGTGTPDMKAIITDSANWVDDTKSIAVTTNIPGVATQPRYMIQHAQHVVPPGGIGFGGYGANKAGSELDYFKIYARGTGGTDTAQVVLESFFGMKF